jgi:hypothetical protein
MKRYKKACHFTKKAERWRQCMTIPTQADVVARYPSKVQAIRSRGLQARLYVYYPLPLAAAIGLTAGEQVEWELLDRGELHLVRQQTPLLRARRRASSR